MYKYEYEKVNCNFERWTPNAGGVYRMGDYRSIINRRAENGWRYAGYVPTMQRGTGHIQELELIFEKEE